VKIVVCVKQVPAGTAEKRYTAEFRLDRAASEAVVNPLDEYAIEQALRLKEAGAVDEVVYLSMGPDSAAEAVRRSLAMGGDAGVLVTDAALAGADAWVTARVLAAALDKLAPEVALMGMSSDDAKGSLVPGAVAAIRFARETGRPYLGTCGGFQHALLEYAEAVWGLSNVAHAELDPQAPDPLIAPLDCGLVEATGEVRFAPGSRLARIYCAPRATETYHCR